MGGRTPFAPINHTQLCKSHTKFFIDGTIFRRNETHPRGNTIENTPIFPTPVQTVRMETKPPLDPISNRRKDWQAACSSRLEKPSYDCDALYG
jgi:hypothetical protein